MNYYKIQKGDSLASIARKFNTSLEKLEELNTVDYLQDLLYKIARKYNINPELLANLNGLNMDDYIYPNQELLIPKSGYSYYITAEGDTLDTVAQMFKSNKSDIVNNNPTIYLLKDQVLVTKR